ncbi:bifunctional phosphoribosylaminoimidazolecarboxamide formyltransferase/IMP cyclohydrolase [Candidatus Peregrinibacteria bacterium]|nr:bifunctional phosphoribosylaminoimidazolecarboxamide formyltransferase/IMP cyclohydrolase [Candidatus Peregrinibacteria bacterium]
MPIKRALISVFEKEGILEFAKQLDEMGVEILSTGGTAKILKEGGIEVKDVSDYTGFPEMMHGRVKTLHPLVHGGILAVRDNDGHMQQAKDQGVEMIDMVVINLYPFEKTVAKEGVSEEEIIENIDIGGPSMVRSAAKNFKYVTVLTDPADYDVVLEEMKENGECSLEMRRKLAGKAFKLTTGYDTAIKNYFAGDDTEGLNLHFYKVMDLRYGENPAQEAAFYKDPSNKDTNIPNAEVLGGKQLSYNNIVDADSALNLVMEFKEPTAVFVKHNNPCGVASASEATEAFMNAYKVDPMSAFGCIIAVNFEVTDAILDIMKAEKMFVELIIAPSYTESALKRLKTRKNLRILNTGEFKEFTDKRVMKRVNGGLLVQSRDEYQLKPDDLKVVTKLEPSEEEINSLLFATLVCKHVISNSVVMAKGKVTTGIGAGQMSRVDSVKIACSKGGDRIEGSVMASDAFFPFPDAMEQAAANGVKAFIQPGGSIRDDEVIARADELGVSMVFSGRRYFRH